MAGLTASMSRGRIIVPTPISVSGFNRPERARNVPPGMIGVPHDVALGGEPDVLALERMAERNVRDLLRQPDREADMRAVDRMAQARIAGARGVLGPALAVHRVEFVGLADVVAERAGEHDVAVDLDLRMRLRELLDHLHREMRDAAQMIGLVAALEHQHVRIALARACR